MTGHAQEGQDYLNISYWNEPLQQLAKEGFINSQL